MNVNVATFGLFLTESYCTASEDLEYIAQVHMNHFYGTFLWFRLRIEAWQPQSSFTFITWKRVGRKITYKLNISFSMEDRKSYGLKRRGGE